MTITTKITEKEYRQASRYMVSLSPVMKIVLVIIAAGIVFNIGSALAAGKSLVPVLLPVLLIAAIFFTVLFVSIKSSFKANKIIRETIVYELTDDQLIITGESFQGKLAWSSVHKVLKNGAWLFLFQNKQVANIIPLENISPEAWHYLKELLQKHGVENNL